VGRRRAGYRDADDRCAVIGVLCRRHVAEVFDRALLECVDRFQQCAAGLGERVLDSDRHVGVDGAAYESVAFESAQGLGQHLLTTRWDSSTSSKRGEHRRAHVNLAY